jgi:putative addiction module killer protein
LAHDFTRWILDYGAIYVTISVVDVREYLDRQGRSPYRLWFDRLNAPAAAKVATAVTRYSLGNMSNVKGVGSGVFELRIDFGPGYRVYLGQDGDHLIILLGGGTKQRQQRDINDAIANWEDYKRRK